MIHKGTYFVLSLFNLAALIYLMGTGVINHILIFYTGILINHFLLIKGVSGMLAAQKKSAFLIMKFFVLIGVFLYVMKVVPDALIPCVISYIFQLIILALSIKRDSKKN